MDKYFMRDAFNELWPEKPERYPYSFDNHPTARAAMALTAYNNEDADFDFHIEWLLNNQHPETGGWEFRFDWEPKGYGKLKAPWICGMTQGMAMSALARAGQAAQVQEAIVKAWKPFMTRVSDGGLLLIEGGNTWYVGIPSLKTKAQILNENLFAIIGMMEAQLEYKSLVLAGMDTLERNLRRFDLRLPFFKWSRYDDKLLWYSGIKYHSVMVQQLAWLGRFSEPCRCHAEKWQRWEARYKNSRAEFMLLRLWIAYRKAIGL